MFDDIANRKKLTDHIHHVEQGIASIEQAYAALERAKDSLDTVGRHVMPSELDVRMMRLDNARQEIYRRAWQQAFDDTGLSQIMDAQAVKEFHRGLDDKAPAFNLDNVQSVFIDMQNQADDLFRRGVVNVFRQLSPDYKRHQQAPFAVPRRIILTYACQTRFMGGLEVNTRAHSQINDIDRVVKVLGEGHYEPRALEAAFNNAWKDGATYEDDYYLARAHKNGNIHLTFKRDDLLERINDLIAEYYGPTLGDERKGRRAA